MSSLAAVIFDFDGVIADTERAHLRAFQAAFQPHGWTLEDAEYFETYLGYDDRAVVERFVRHRQLPSAPDVLEAVLDAKIRAYEALLADGSAVLMPSAPACITHLAAKVPLAIASGARREEILWILERAGLASAFRAIVGADDVAEGKPSPAPYLEAARRLGVHPASAVAIEDSVWGLVSARGAGLRTIGVTSTYTRSVLVSADAVVDSLSEITFDLLGSLVR
jgi:beta-phosphoglucomutase